jgi:hypothetical protein
VLAVNVRYLRRRALTPTGLVDFNLDIHTGHLQRRSVAIHVFRFVDSHSEDSKYPISLQNVAATLGWYICFHLIDVIVQRRLSSRRYRIATFFLLPKCAGLSDLFNYTCFVTFHNSIKSTVV